MKRLRNLAAGVSLLALVGCSQEPSWTKPFTDKKEIQEWLEVPAEQVGDFLPQSYDTRFTGQDIRDFQISRLPASRVNAYPDTLNSSDLIHLLTYNVTPQEFEAYPDFRNNPPSIRQLATSGVSNDRAIELQTMFPRVGLPGIISIAKGDNGLDVETVAAYDSSFSMDDRFRLNEHGVGPERANRVASLIKNRSRIQDKDPITKQDITLVERIERNGKPFLELESKYPSHLTINDKLNLYEGRVWPSMVDAWEDISFRYEFNVSVRDMIEFRKKGVTLREVEEQAKREYISSVIN